MRTLPPRRPAHQDGNILIMASVVLSTAIILLASIDIGFLFYQKRDLQKIADMAAIAGAQQLVKEGECASAIPTAIASAQQHGFPAQPSVIIGRWDPHTLPAPEHFDAKAGCEDSPNAVRVTVNRTFGSFFGVWVGQSVHAKAIAQVELTEPHAVFSVASRLMHINSSGTVPSLLAALGADIDGTTLLSHEGLANARVTPGGLLRNLGFDIPLTADVLTMKEIVNIDTSGNGCANNHCPLEALLGAIKVGGQEQTLDVGALGISANQLGLNVKLFSDEDGRGLLTFLETANQAALNANISALELVKSAIGVANSGNDNALDLGATIPGVLDAKLGIVEPPVLGYGGKGATAYTSQVRVFAHIQHTLLSANLLSANIPIAIDVVTGKATITDICHKQIDGEDVATIEIDAPILKLSVGDIDASNAFSKKTANSDDLQDKTLLNFLNGELKINTNLSVDGLPNSETHDFVKGETYRMGKNELELGTTLSDLIPDLMEGLLGKLLGAVFTQGTGSIDNDNLAINLLNAAENSLDAALSTVKGALGNLTNFVNGLQPAVQDLLGGSLTSLLKNVSTLIDGLLGGLGELLNLTLNCGLFPSDQCKLSLDLKGEQTSNGQSISKVLLTLLSLVVNLLGPILNQLGNSLASLLHNLLGTEFGLVDVTLIDLNCSGGPNVRLVH